MAIDPYPSKRNDPAWDDFADGHAMSLDTPAAVRPARARPVPVLPEIDVHAMIRLVEQTQRVQSAIHEPEKPKLPWWSKHETAKTCYWAVVTPTLVTGCANLSAHEWGVTGPAATGAALSVLASALGVYGLNHKWRGQGLALMLGATVGGASFSASASGSGWTEVMAWLASAAATVGFKVVWNRKHAADKAKVALTEAKIRTELAKGDAVKSKSAIVDSIGLLRLQAEQRAATDGVAPAFQGATAEERVLRRAVWDVFGAELLDCDMVTSRTGYVAVLGLPVSVPRNAFRSSWDKVATALRCSGRFIVADGRRSNEIELRYVAADALHSDTTWYPGREGIGLCTVTGDVVDVPVEGVHSMTGGRTNMGKSAYARIQLMRTLPDPKRAEAIAWEGKLRVAGTSADLDARYEEIYDMLCELMAEFRHRQTLFPGLYWEASAEYPTLFITIDEGASLKRMSGVVREDLDGNKYKPFEDAMEIAETLYGEARVVGMWFNWASQYLAKGTSIPQLVKENVGAVIGLTTLGGEGDRMLFGEEAGKKGWTPSELCGGVQGRALVKHLDRPSYPVQLWHVTGEHIAAQPDAEPWRSRAYSRTFRTSGPVEQSAAAYGPEDAQFLRDAGHSIRKVAELTGLSKSAVERSTTA